MVGKILEWHASAYGNLDKRSSKLDTKLKRMEEKMDQILTRMGPQPKAISRSTNDQSKRQLVSIDLPQAKPPHEWKEVEKVATQLEIHDEIHQRSKGMLKEHCNEDVATQKNTQQPNNQTHNEAYNLDNLLPGFARSVYKASLIYGIDREHKIKETIMHLVGTVHLYRGIVIDEIFKSSLYEDQSPLLIGKFPVISWIYTVSSASLLAIKDNKNERVTNTNSNEQIEENKYDGRNENEDCKVNPVRSGSKKNVPELINKVMVGGKQTSTPCQDSPRIDIKVQNGNEVATSLTTRYPHDSKSSGNVGDSLHVAELVDNHIAEVKEINMFKKACIGGGSTDEAKPDERIKFASIEMSSITTEEVVK
eukprot:Gb_02410 [translate_table: standard]